MRPTTRWRALSALTTLLALASPAAAQQGDGPSVGFGTDPGICHGDRYFVHVPAHASTARLPRDFAHALEAALNGAQRPLAFAVAPTLPRRDTGVWSDQHQRFLTVAYHGRRPPCDVLSQIRSTYQRLSPDGPPIYVGRECAAVGLGAFDVADGDWPLAVMGAPAEPAPADGVRVALLDTAPDPGSHGDAMRALISEVADVTIAAYPVLGADGTGTLSDVAVGVDRALAEARTTPLVVNMSIGWPPELEQPRDGLGCLEDPAGEAVRYTLLMARLRDEGALAAGHDGPTAVVMAAGNRATMVAHQVRADDGVDPFGARTPTRQQLFYPAERVRDAAYLASINRSFDVDDASGDDWKTPLAAVAATDVHDLRSAFSPPAMTHRLVAPGVRVTAAGRTWTGSSVAAAYTTGATALALTRARSGAAALAAVWDAATWVETLPSGRKLRRVTLGDARAPDREVVQSSNELDITAAPRTRNGRFPAVYRALLDQFTVGRAGPQPPGDGCPECAGKRDPIVLYGARSGASSAPTAAPRGGEPLFPRLASPRPLRLEIYGVFGLEDAVDGAARAADEPYLYLRWSTGQGEWIALDPAVVDGADFMLVGDLTPPEPGAEPVEALLVARVFEGASAGAHTKLAFSVIPLD